MSKMFISPRALLLIGPALIEVNYNFMSSLHFNSITYYNYIILLKILYFNFLGLLFLYCNNIKTPFYRQLTSGIIILKNIEFFSKTKEKIILKNPPLHFPLFITAIFKNLKPRKNI